MLEEHSTRDKFIEAGVRLCREGRATILRSLTAGTVADEAGFHRQTFYRHWATQGEYVDALLEHVFSIRHVPAGRRAAVVEKRSGAFEDLVRDQVRGEFDRLWRDPNASVRMGLLSMGQLRDGRPRELAEEFHRDAIDRLAVAFAEIFDACGRCPAEPHTIEDVARAVRGQIGGFLTEAALSGDVGGSRRLLESAVLITVTVMTEPYSHAG